MFRSIANIHLAILRLGILLLLINLALPVGAQNNLVLYNEDFSGGNTSSFSLNISGPGSNSGTNQWIINNQFNGLGAYPNTTGQGSTTSGNITSPGGNYLHIHDQTSAPSPANANYDPGATSDQFTAMTSGICTKGFTNVRFSFFWVGEGSVNDYAELYYSANGGGWTQIGPSQMNNQSLWNYQLLTNPAFDNANDLRFGFRWKNSTSAPPSDISFGVDDLFIIGDVDNTTPATITVPSVPASVCRGTNMTFTYNLSQPLCDGTYSIELMNGVTTVATFVSTINYPTTSGAFGINIPATAPLGNCYQIRVSRVSPPPQITGTLSACFAVVDCPNDITTLQPIVTVGSESPGGPGVCVGSAIDVPFWATGTYNSGNVYTAQLSDSNGSFANPQTIGTLPSQMAFDPTVVPSPGSVSGIVPAAPDGCGYMIRVVSSNPVATGVEWGPFCIVNCDIETNNRQDTSVCISDTAGVTFTMSYTINNPPATPATYPPNNVFEIEVLSSMTFNQVNLGGLGSVTSNTSGNITVTIPPLPTLATMGIVPGLYYVRVVASNSSTPNNALGTLVRLTIGAPAVPAPSIISSDDLICQGDIVTFILNPYDPASDYQWFLNGSPFPGPSQPTYPLSILFNSGPGLYTVQVEETNFGCPGPLSNPDTVIMNPPPIANINGPISVCEGDTATYFVTFINNTAYGWSLSPPNAGTILDNGADEIQIVWDQLDSGLVTLNLDYASNLCGSTSGTYPITIRPSPQVDVGPDIDLPCAGDTVSLFANATGGTPGYFYQWPPAPSLTGFLTQSPLAQPVGSETYTITVTDAGACTGTDDITVTVLADIQVDAGPDLDLCWGESGQMGGAPTGPPSATYTWNPALGLNDPTASNPITSTDNDLLYLVTIYDPVTTCTKFDTVFVSVTDTIYNPVQVIDTCGNASVPLDAGPGLSYSWDNGNQGQFYITSEDGTYQVTVTPDQGCDFINTFQLSNRPMELVLEEVDFCEEEEAVLDAGPGLDYRWDNLEDGQMRTITEAGGYRVTVTPDGGCIFAKKFQAYFHPNISEEIRVPLCEGNSVELEPPTGAKYRWSTSAITPTVVISDPQHVFVTVTPQEGCNHFIFYDVEGIPTNHTQETITFCEGDFVRLDAGWGDRYSWPDGETESFIFARDPGQYICEVTIDDAKDGCSYQAVFDLTHDDCIDAIFLPSAFSPFGDGLNDVFGPTVVGDDIFVTDFKIYDRWGEQLFSSDGEPWDGHYEGGLVPIGVYVYRLEYVQNNETKRIVGSVTVINSRK